MIYSNSFPELEKFIQDPIHNIEPIAKQHIKPSKITKILLRTPLLRRFISNNESLRILEETILSLSNTLTTDLKSLPASNVAYDKKYLTDCLSIFSKKISFDVSEENIEYKDILIQSHLIVHSMEKMEYHCNRIFEVENSTSNDIKNILKIDNLWEYFYISEMYFLIKNGYMKIEAKNHGFRITRKDSNKELNTFWLSEILEFHSKRAYEDQLNAFFDKFKRKENIGGHPLGYQALDAYVDLTLDKIYSINVNHISAESKRFKKYKLLRSIIAFYLLVELRSKTHGYAERSWIYQQNIISYEDMEHIENRLDLFKDYKYGEHSNFIYAKNNLFLRGSLEKRYGLRKFSSKVLHNYPEGKENFNSAIGLIFERECILERLRKLNLDNYMFFSGIEPNQKNNLGYDIDLIIKDIPRNHYYFVQVKHFMSDSPTYLHEQVRTLYGDKCDQAINSQLSNLRKNIDETSVVQKLKHLGITDASSKNSSFIFLHNLPHLDLYIHNGVYCYEWNTFRNLIDDGRFYVSHNNEQTEIKLNKSFAFNNPNSIANEYIENESLKFIDKSHYELYKNSVVSLLLSKHHYICDML